MRNIKKITLILLLLGNTAIAAPLSNTLFSITPSETSLYLSSNGSGNVMYTITNNATDSATPSITPGYQSSGNNLTISSNTCNISLSPGASCTFRVLISGSNQPENFTITPRVCGYNGFVCSIPPNAVTVTVTRPAAGLVSRAYEQVTNNNSSTTTLIGININNTSDVISAELNYSSSINSIAISPDGSNVYATQKEGGGSSSVVFFDVVNDSLIKTQEVFLSPPGLSLHSSPPTNLQMTITPDGSTLFITQSAGVGLRSNNTFITAASLFRIDINSNPSVTTIADPDHILGTASGLVVSPDGKTLYVGTDTDYIVALPVTADSVNSSNIVAEGSIPNDSHLGLAIDPAGNKLYVGNYTEGSVSILAVNGTQGHVEDTILTGEFSGASGLAISPDGTTLYVAETQNDEVLAVSLNGSNESLVQPGIIGAFGLSLSLNGSILYVTQSVDDINRTTVINTAEFLGVPSIIPIEGSSSTIGQFIGP